MSDPFDVIPFADIKGNWKKLGSGSFGNVYKGRYLGIDVAIKEVLPSNDYDVAKYFEREWRLMKEARHPNVVLYLGLSRAPEPDGRIFIISEFIENGNLRSYIHDQSKPLPWRLRLSFSIDIARALAYLHARRCIHRDLKGENLLVTDNGRLKITDFGFARIAARNEAESKRLTFCGTDSYMSPEILLGEEFDLPTDIFSFGIILCEIAAKKLADEDTFKRTAPDFGIDVQEVRKLVSADCPPAFLDLCLDCLSHDPKARPTTLVILERLQDIEAELVSCSSEENETHVGSVKFIAKKRPGPGLRIPSFGMALGQDIRNLETSMDRKYSDDSDEEMIEAVKSLEQVNLNSSWLSLSTDANGQVLSTQRLLNDSLDSHYSTTVIRSRSTQPDTINAQTLSSVLTVRPSPVLEESTQPALPTMSDSFVSIGSYHTAYSLTPSATGATEGGSTIRTTLLVHRFTLIKPGAKRHGANLASQGNMSVDPQVAWNPLDLFLSSGLLVAKCDVCGKRLGWKPVLECDDCGLRSHVRCADVAPRDCGIRPTRPGIHHILASMTPISKGKRSSKTTLTAIC